MFTELSQSVTPCSNDPDPSGLSEIGSDTMDAENESVPEGGFMATFRTWVNLH